MLEIVESYHCMQFQGKLINQTWENDKKPSSRPNIDLFGPNSGPQIFFLKIWLFQSLDIMVSYHPVEIMISYYREQYQKQLMIQSWENLVTNGRTNGRADGRGRYLTNVESPLSIKYKLKLILKNFNLFLLLSKHMHSDLRSNEFLTQSPK